MEFGPHQVLVPGHRPQGEGKGALSTIQAWLRQGEAWVRGGPLVRFSPSRNSAVQYDASHMPLAVNQRCNQSTQICGVPLRLWGGASVVQGRGLV